MTPVTINEERCARCGKYYRGWDLMVRVPSPLCPDCAEAAAGEARPKWRTLECPTPA